MPCRPLPPKKWTVLMYFAGDNNLEKGVVGDALDAERRGSNLNVNLVLSSDGGSRKALASAIKATPPRSFTP